MDKLRELYAALLAKRKLEMKENLTLQLKTIKTRLDNIYELLELWNQYTEVIYMPESQLNFVEMLEKIDMRPDSVAYKSRMKEQDIAERLNMLFGSDDKKLDSQKAADIDYETVNEGNTTDTTSGIDEETLVRRHNEYTVIKEQKEKDLDGNMGDLGLKFRAARDQSIKEA